MERRALWRIKLYFASVSSKDKYIPGVQEVPGHHCFHQDLEHPKENRKDHGYTHSLICSKEPCKLIIQDKFIILELK